MNKNKKINKQTKPISPKKIRTCYKNSWNAFICINKNIKKSESTREKFINLLMVQGNKTKAYVIFNQAIYLMRKKVHTSIKIKTELSVKAESNRYQFAALPKALTQFTDTQPYSIRYGHTECDPNIVLPRETAVSINKIKQLGIKTNLISSKFVKAWSGEAQSNLIEPPEQNLGPRAVTDLNSGMYDNTIELLKQNLSSKRLQSLSNESHLDTDYIFAALSLKVLLDTAIKNVKPSIEVRKVRIAGTTYQVPAIISKNRQKTLAIRWIIDATRKRKKTSNISFSECLAQELVDAYNEQGGARQKRDELHKIAELNRAYTRYRWW